MSKANSPIKVLRTALKRVEKAWIRGSWSGPIDKTPEGKYIYGVCLEGALFGYCEKPQTEAQVKAAQVCQEVINERPVLDVTAPTPTIPNFNDLADSRDEIIEVIKTAIIRLETEKMMDFSINDAEVTDLL